MATLTTESKSPGDIAQSLDLDNVQLDTLRIRTCPKDDKIVTIVESNNLHTLLATLDDIICCQRVAEKMIG